MFASFQWASGHGDAALKPRALGLNRELLAYQRAHHPLYQKYCALSEVPKDPKSILDYPPLPVESFKRADLNPFDASRIVAEFYSSGTTGSQRSSHKFRDLSLMQRAIFYQFSLMLGRCVIKEARFISLMPSPKDQPHSSLGYMIGQFVENIGVEGSNYFFTPDKGLDVEGLIETFEAAKRDGVALHLMGPSFAYVQLLDALGNRRFQLPEGSCLLETGGYKGQTREVPKTILRDQLSETLGIARRGIYGEYGMSELSSQAYEVCAWNCEGELPEEGLYIFPNWMECIIFNPDNMAPVLPGHEGQIALFDLCNIDSAAFILTGDIGMRVELPAELSRRIVGHPSYALKLSGRAPDAVAKGCSMAWDEWANAVRTQNSAPK